MFLDRGYEAMSLDTLIARAGGSRRNIYDRFGGKEGLFIEVVNQLCANFLRHSKSWMFTVRMRRRR